MVALMLANYENKGNSNRREFTSSVSRYVDDIFFKKLFYLSSIPFKNDIKKVNMI